MINSLRQMNYIQQVAKRVFDVYGENFYEAINIAESITLKGDVTEDASRVYNFLQGEV